MVFWWVNRSHGWEERYMHIAMVEVQRGIARFITVGLFQNMLQAEAPIALVALSAAITGTVD